MFCTIDWTQKIDKVTIGPGDHRWQGMTERHFIQAAKDLASAKSGCRFALGAKMSTWEHTHRLCQIEAQAGQTSQHCFKTVCSISSRMAWDWCKMVCSSVVKILVKLDLDRLSLPRVIIPGHEALAPLMLVAKPLVSFKVRLPYHLPRISLLINFMDL